LKIGKDYGGPFDAIDALLFPCPMDDFLRRAEKRRESIARTRARIAAKAKAYPPADPQREEPSQF
jgi:hypothetical protein